VPFGSPAVAPPAPPPASLGAAGDQSGGTGGEINLIAVSVKPADSLPGELPPGSRRGLFTAGPKTGVGRGTTGDGGPVRVPNLAIESPSRANSRPAGDDLLSSLTRRNSIRDGQAPPPDIDIVYNEKPIDIDNPFVGRPVYTMAVNMPNVTSYRGDWVLQFAELVEAKEGETDAEIEQRLSTTDDELTPPFPVIKVDPRYVASAIREQVQGIVVFYAIISEEGVLSKLRLVRGVDERLDAAASEALSKWEFRAAMKNGEAIAVESLIRIPFRLDPSVKMRY
jgi:TonB family protein